MDQNFTNSHPSRGRQHHNSKITFGTHNEEAREGAEDNHTNESRPSRDAFGDPISGDKKRENGEIMREAQEGNVQSTFANTN